MVARVEKASNERKMRLLKRSVKKGMKISMREIEEGKRQ